MLIFRCIFAGDCISSVYLQEMLIFGCIFAGDSEAEGASDDGPPAQGLPPRGEPVDRRSGETERPGQG